MPDLATLELASAAEWRRWLRARSRSSLGVWLVFRKGSAEGLTYPKALDEALCFGWIDSIVRRIDEGRYARKFTPRKDTRKWSEVNKRHARRLIAEKRMTPAGLRAIGVSLDPPPAPKERPPGRLGRRAVVPDMIRRGLRSRPAAQRFFASLAPSYRARYVSWIMAAKREATRHRRLAESLDLLAQGVKVLLR